MLLTKFHVVTTPVSIKNVYSILMQEHAPRQEDHKTHEGK